MTSLPASTQIEARIFESVGFAVAVVAVAVLVGKSGTTRPQIAVLVLAGLSAALPFAARLRAEIAPWKADLGTAALLAAGGIATYPPGGLGLLAPSALMAGAATVRLVDAAAVRRRALKRSEGGLAADGRAPVRRLYVWAVTTAVLAFSSAALIWSFGLLIMPVVWLSATWTVIVWDRLPRPRPPGAHLAATVPIAVLALTVFFVLGPIVAKLLERTFG